MISQTVGVPADVVTLAGDLDVPESPLAAAVCAYGLDSSRLDPRSRTVAAELRSAGIGTLSLDLLSEREDATTLRTADQRFDVGLLGRRVVAAVDWLTAQPDLRGLPVALLGAGIESAAVLRAAADLPDRVRTAVVWAGRPDLAGDDLRRVRVPVLIIAGDRDDGVLRTNQRAAQSLGAPHSVRVIAGANRLFEEPGAWEEAVAMAKEWCLDRMGGEGAR
ncbi:MULTISPECIES: dienelactone hydrolase family protein [unclassified Streptomyces]|uniref:dienelactone hydrolase family protein n=1 Tax=unclassified Streptomyces TaxID=2593676 RepID=UPI003D70574B